MILYLIKISSRSQSKNRIDLSWLQCIKYDLCYTISETLAVVSYNDSHRIAVLGMLNLFSIIISLMVIFRCWSEWYWFFSPKDLLKCGADILTVKFLQDSPARPCMINKIHYTVNNALLFVQPSLKANLTYRLGLKALKLKLAVIVVFQK